MVSIKKQVKKICSTKFCTRPVRVRKNKKQSGSYCSTCEKKRWREKNPMKAAFQTLRHNSTRRKVFFDLTFEQFKQFCYETDYMAEKGRTKGSYSIDRIVEGKKPGYTFSNIQKLSVTDNTLKEHERRNRKKILIYDWETKYATVK